METRSDFKTTLKVIVGIAQEEFIVHEDVVRQQSPFFGAACSREWKENKMKHVFLPDAHPNTFKVYLEWAYFRKRDFLEIVGMQYRRAIPGVSATDVRNEIASRLCRLWMLADYLGDAECKNRAIDALVEEHNRTLFDFGKSSGIAVMEMIHDTVLKDSPLWKFSLDSVAATIATGRVRECMTGLPKDVVVDVFESYVEKQLARGHRQLKSKHYYV